MSSPHKIAREQGVEPRSGSDHMGPSRWSTVRGRQLLLRLGYTAVFTILSLSIWEAYRIQQNVSQQHIDIFYRYVDQDEALISIRTSLWRAGNYVRDFFIHPSAAEAELLTRRLKELQEGDERILGALEKTVPNNAALGDLRSSLARFWSSLGRAPATMLRASEQEQIDFVRNVIEPQRGELSDMLRTVGSAGKRYVQESSNEIIRARHIAAQRLLTTLIVGGLLALLISLASMRHSDRLTGRAEMHYSEAEQARTEMQQLSARLLQVEEESRRQLARELHDEVGQTLALLQIEISRLQGEASRGQADALHERLRFARGLAEDGVQTIRNISALLRPALLDDLGLVPALQFLIEQFQRRSGISCEFVQERVFESIPDAVKTCVYRVVQEALHNCEKHSGAAQASVSLRQVRGALAVEIRDDGRGFEHNEKGMPMQNRGLGLIGMRERATIVGGRFEIQSAPGAGTRVVVTIPVTERATRKGPPHSPEGALPGESNVHTTTGLEEA